MATAPKAIPAGEQKSPDIPLSFLLSRRGREEETRDEEAG